MIKPISVTRISLIFSFLLMGSVAFARDYRVELYVYRGLHQHASIPSYREFRYTIAVGLGVGCASQGCPCPPSACAATWGPNVPCFAGYCEGSAYNSSWCTGDYGNESFHCNSQLNACILQDLHEAPCGLEHVYDGVGNGYDPNTGITRIGIPPHPQQLYLDACKDYDYVDEEWLPEYGDIICFRLRPNQPMYAFINLLTSTYEGIAMNYGVPETDLDTLSDLVSWPGPESINLSYDGLVDDLGHWGWTGPLYPSEARYLYFRVQDYAAAAALAITSPGGDALASAKIPHNYERFLSNSDPDSDGFTSWDEYRGFIGDGGSYGSHVRTDSINPQLFIDDDTGTMDWNTAQICSEAEVYMVQTWPENYRLHRWWMESQVGRTGMLSEAGFDPVGSLYGQDQSAARFEVDNTLPWPTLGVSVPWNMGGGQIMPGPSGRNGPVRISMDNLRRLLDDIYVQDRGLPSSGGVYDQVFETELTRTFMHELGHVLGINHHEPTTEGSYDCVMKYANEDGSDWPDDETGWEAYNWGVGYLDDQYNCYFERRLRP